MKRHECQLDEWTIILWNKKKEMKAAGSTAQKNIGECALN
jgi:hypothetical protein